MATYYLFQSSLFLDMVGPMLSVIAVMVVFATLYRNSEIHPLLAAGIPTYRLIVPLLVGTVLVVGVLVVNRELVIPRIHHHLRAPRSEDKALTQDVQPIYDHATQIWIGGDQLVRGANRLKGAEFDLPQGIADDLTPLRAQVATYHAATSGKPAGWHLQDVQPQRDQLRLSERGQRVVLAMPNADDLFIVIDVSFSQLSNHGKSYVYASTAELFRQIKNPSSGNSSVRSLTLHFHSRLIQPLMSMVVVFVVVPLIVRKEGLGLVSNIAICTAVMGLLFGVTQLGLYLGNVNFVSPSLAIGAPVIFSGTLAAWLAGIAQT
jgi:lipopolysaccharide export system permease protein